MGKSKKRKARPAPLLCEECGRQKPLAKDIYRVVERKGFRGKVFCSLLCIDVHLARTLPGWQSVGVRSSSSIASDAPAMHRVHIVRSSEARLYSES